MRVLAIGAILTALAVTAAMARDDGRFAGSPLKEWFDGLRSERGPCCSDADGTKLDDPDWTNDSGHYRVRIAGEWYDVPDDAVITEPNRIGIAMVWPIYRFQGGQPIGKPAGIRCFMPGALT